MDIILANVPKDVTVFKCKWVEQQFGTTDIAKREYNNYSPNAIKQALIYEPSLSLEEQPWDDDYDSVTMKYVSFKENTKINIRNYINKAFLRESHIYTSPSELTNLIMDFYKPKPLNFSNLYNIIKDIYTPYYTENQLLFGEIKLVQDLSDDEYDSIISTSWQNLNIQFAKNKIYYNIIVYNNSYGYNVLDLNLSKWKKCKWGKRCLNKNCGCTFRH